MSRLFGRTLALSIAAVLLVAGCGDTGDEPPASASGGNDGTGGESGAAGFPVTIENCGRMLTFEQPPSRVVTGTHPNLETLLELGVGEDRFAGRIRHVESVGFLPGHEEVYRAIPEITSETSELPPRETLLSTGADLVVTLGYFDFDPESGYATIEELQAAGAQAYVMANRCNEEEAAEYEIPDFFDDVRDLGAIFGVSERADELVAEYEALLADVDQRVRGLEPVRAVAASPSPAAFSVLGVGLFNEVSRRAGGANAFAEADSFAEVNVEEVASANIQAFVTFPHSPDQPVEERRRLIEEAAPTSEGIVTNRVLDVPISSLSPGPRQVQLVEDVARLLHPEAVGSA